MLRGWHVTEPLFYRNTMKCNLEDKFLLHFDIKGCKFSSVLCEEIQRSQCSPNP